MAETVSFQMRQETVREAIRQGAKFDRAYIFMNTLAAVIACYGLFADSPAVVIGAMIVAMLLGPIAAAALALVDGDTPLLRHGLGTLLGGMLAVIVTAFILGLIHRDIPITNEIMARTAPNLLDLMVALAGGAAGPYATVSPRLSVAFVGVAIATALVPPLSSASILLAGGEYALSFGAFLLAFTNIVAIQFASSAVLWLTGIRKVTSRGGLATVEFLRTNAISLIILVGLATLLSSNLQSVISRELFQTTVRGVLTREIDASPGSNLVQVTFENSSGETIVRAVVGGPIPPSAQQVAALEAQHPPSPDRVPLELRVRFVDTIVINRNGRLFNDTGFDVTQ